MCFSATASFAAAALLLGIGTLTLKSALAAHRQADLPFAAIPMLFALQQLIEGVIWLTFSHQSLVGAYLMYVLVAFPIGSRLAAHGSARRIRFTALLRGRDDDAVPVVDRSGLSPLWRAQARSPSIKGQRHVGTSFTGGLNAAPALPKQRFGPSPDGSGLCAGRRSHATVLTHE